MQSPGKYILHTMINELRVIAAIVLWRGYCQEKIIRFLLVLFISISVFCLSHLVIGTLLTPMDKDAKKGNQSSRGN